MENNEDVLINKNNDISKNPDDFEILQVLGAGNFGQVLKVLSKKNSKIYAMKKSNKTRIFEQYGKRKYYLNEMLILKKLNDPSVIKCYQIFETKENKEEFLYFITEFMNNGDLDSFNEINYLLKIIIPEAKLWEIFYKCLKGLYYIHNEGIIHRDIKPSNLFLDDEFNIKIGDFNVSAIIDKNFAKKFSDNEDEIEELESCYTNLGTDLYKAPEVRRKEDYTQKADIYSMGKSFYELCYGWRSIYSKKYHNNNKPSIEMEEFINKMIDDDHTKRPTTQEALSEATKYFIKYYKNTSIESFFDCFNNFPNVKEYFHNNEEVNRFFETKKEIAKMCSCIIMSMENNNDSEIIQKKENIYKLRHILAKEGFNIKADNIEIDPGIVIPFFIKKLNTELNKKSTQDIRKESKNEEITRFKLLSKRYHFTPGSEQYNFRLFINAYNRRILSFISSNFFSHILTKRTCKNCGIQRCYFSQLYFIPININILRKEEGLGVNDISLVDGFRCLKKKIVNISEDKELVCKNCNRISKFRESKNFYRTAKNLIIIFDRGENHENNSFINFDENLTLNNFDTGNNHLVYYHLIGIISKLQEEYISFIKINNIWISSKTNEINFEEAKKIGTVIALFYYSEDQNLTLKNEEKINFETIKLEDEMFVDSYNFNKSRINLLNNNGNNSDTNIQNLQNDFTNININSLSDIKTQKNDTISDINNQLGSGSNISSNVYNINIQPIGSNIQQINSVEGISSIHNMNSFNNNSLNNNNSFNNNINIQQVNQQPFENNQFNGFIGNNHQNNYYNPNQNNFGMQNNMNYNGPNFMNQNNNNNNINIMNNYNNQNGFGRFGENIEWL